MSELQSVPEAATAKYVPVVTDPGSLRIDPAERLARQLLEPKTFAFLQGLREIGVCPSLERDELLRVAAQVAELEVGDQRAELLCEHTKRDTASGADRLCVFDQHQLNAARVQETLARVMPELSGANLARIGVDRGSPYALRLEPHVVAIEEDLARDGTLSLVSLVRAANTMLARVQSRSRFVAVLVGEREVYATMDVTQALQLSKSGLLADSFEDVMSIAAW